MMRVLASLVLMAFIAACATQDAPQSTPEQIAAVAYRDPGPTRLTIFTMVNNRSGSGGHTAMLISGSQQVLFDPAGSYRDPRLVMQGDVIYGMSPGAVKNYKSAHARATHHVVSQEIEVTPAQAEQALRLAQAYGRVAAAHCANSTTNILSQIEGFPPIKVTYFPNNLMEQISQIPGVKTTRLYENDDGDVIDAVQAAALVE
jgi:hypothetical protein